MEHKHIVRDGGAHFTIDQFTRQVKNGSINKTTIVQFDHNSERLTFEIPLEVDGHTMTQCDLIEIHFINISTDGKSQNKGTYAVNDIKAEGDTAVFTWLISQNATQLAGSLNFFIVFKCTENGETVYRWGTEIYKNLSISDGIDNGEEILVDYPDILAQWKNDLFGVGDTQEQRLLTVSAEQQAAIVAKGKEVLATIPDEYEELQTGVDTLFNSVASGIKGKMSSTIVRADDVSPVEHEVVLKAHGKNLFGFNGRTVGDFGGYDSTARRTFVGNCVYVGISASNYYDYQKCSYTYDEENERIEITTAKAWYGVGIDFKIKPDTTYFVSGEIPDGCFVSVTQFDANGNNLGYQHCKDNTFKTNVNADWVVAILSCQITDTVYTFAKIQIEEGEVATEYTPYIDPTTVTLARCGKNLLRFPYVDGGIGDQYASAGITYTVNPDKSVTANGTAETNSYFRLCNVRFGDKYLYENTAIGGFACADCQYDDGNGFSFIMITKGKTVSNKVYYPQIERSEKNTGWESPKECLTYTPTEDGVVHGVTSVSPTMTIMTDTEGVTIDCEYIVNTKTYIDNKIAELLKGSEQA